MFIIAHIPCNCYVYFVHDIIYKLSLYDVFYFEKRTEDMHRFQQIGNIVYINVLSSPHIAMQIMLNPASYIAWSCWFNYSLISVFTASRKTMQRNTKSVWTLFQSAFSCVGGKQLILCRFLVCVVLYRRRGI